MNNGFVIPKAVSGDVTIRQVDLQSRNALDLLSDLNSYKGSELFDLRLNELHSIESISNSRVLKNFSERRARMRDDGYTVRGAYAFTVVEDHDQLVESLHNDSISIAMIDTSKLKFVLGDPKMGIHLFKNAEAALLHYSAQGNNKFCLVMMKVILARGNLVKPQANQGNYVLEPQPMYDHHITREIEDNMNQMVYLFEYDDEAEILQCPRSILPLAIFSYVLKNGRFVRKAQPIPNSFAKKNRPNVVKKVADVIKRKKEELQATNEKSSDTSPQIEVIKETPSVDEPNTSDDDAPKKKFMCRSLTPFVTDIIRDCNYNVTKPSPDNRQALTLSSGVSTAGNIKLLESLTKAGKQYCKIKDQTSDDNSIVKLCLQLPQESDIAKAFHTVVGFIRYQLGDSSVQLALPTSKQDPIKIQRTKVDVALQCNLDPEISKSNGPLSTRRTTTLTSSVMIQCNLNKLFDKYKQQCRQLQDKRFFQKQPTKVVLDEQPGRRGAYDNDENFVLRLLYEAMIDGLKRRPTNTIKDRIDDAFFKYLDRAGGNAERDGVLLDLANLAQQGNWKACLQRIGVPLSAVAENEHTLRSRRAGQMWAQALNSPAGNSMDESQRQISRYNDNIFEEDRPRRHNLFANLLSSSTHSNRQRGGGRQIKGMFFNRKANDLNSILRNTNSIRPRRINRLDEIALYTQLLKMQKPFP